MLWCARSEPVRSRERMVSSDKAGIHSTHIEDLKNPIQLQLPTRDFSLPIARSKVLNQFILPGQFVDLALYFLDTPATKSMVGGRSRSIHRGIDSRLQSVDRIAHRLAELICPLPTRSPPKCITDIAAEYPEVYTVLFVDHLVLITSEPRASRSLGMKTYPDRGEKDSDDSKNCRSRGHARGFLSNAHKTDGNIQRDDSAVALCWLLEFVCHSRKAR